MNLQQFAFNSQSVRIISINGDPWFVATDVLSAIKSTTTVGALKTVVSEGLGDEYVNNTPIPDNLGRLQDTTIIHEAAVTFLVSRSRTATGKAFNRLLHAEILPTIRKTGKYEVVPSHPALPTNFVEALRLAADLEDQRLKLVEQNQALQMEVQILEPKAERYDLVMDSDGWMTGEEICKQLAVPKFTNRKLYDILRTEKVLFKRPDGTNCPYAPWVNEGLAKLRDGQCFDGRMRFSPVFSWKGLDRILDILRKHQVIPKDKQFRFNFDSDKIVAMKRA
ncbi:phage antirepressor KilAC domain-containing protein [Phormidium tenue]|jgi:anti-repressor protein|uniref:Phage antirepressor KilAC domain-containing protein n=1 Tax=Phormidium tenue FACHB-1050 TaxID=2692857 RepID=A0ABR8C7J8_9CYAN|nr:phage antirepressor KilAC domain-containing protein [Phormidium tenue]MBD2316703.1 phage antirepressor KilAC domain-containing protein [Phormidium tenue FACHB-1050]